MSAKNYSLFLGVALVVLGIVGQAQAFSPSSVAGLQAWLNPAATGNITLSGSNVTDFIDSANTTDWECRGTGSYPTYSATAINGQPGLVYPGNTHACLVNNSSILGLAATNTQLDFFGVVSCTGNQGFWTTDTGTQSQWDGLEASVYNSGNVGFHVTSTPDTWKATAAGQVPVNGTAFILEAVYNGAAGTLAIYKNGVSIGSFTGVISTLNANNYVGVERAERYALPAVRGPTRPPSTTRSTATRATCSGTTRSCPRGTDGFSGDAGNVGYYLQQKYGISGAYEATGVPEPSTLALLAAGFAALLGLRLAEAAVIWDLLIWDLGLGSGVSAD